MRFNNLDLNLLVALDHLLHLRNVSAAAERMNMTQSAMSNALHRLRRYFDDELLVKVGRGLQLTPRAEALKDAVRDVLMRIDWSIAKAPQFDPAQSTRQFNLLVSDYTLATLAPAILAQCARTGSPARFHFMQQIDAPENMLDRGDVDLLIIPTDYCTRRHPSEIILEEDFVAVVWEQGKLAGARLTRRAFLTASHVVAQPAIASQSLESVLFRRLGVARRIDVTSFSFAAIPQLLIGTDRIATIHRRLAERARAILPIAMLELPFKLPKMKQAIQWHRNRSQDPGLIWLRGLIKDAAAS
ncbi:MAG: LysR family transcriptional regulator [Pseudomonadota bacterium]|nr:LysR family transcriptional regulator [Pseudomonadota bacterium]